MHPASLDLMAGMLARWHQSQASVLDVGSYDVNGTYRPLVEGRGWQYLGLDTRPGPNVDLVATNPFGYPIGNNAFDVVISGQVMEHVTAIWYWIPELVRVLRPGGLLAIVTHWSQPEHRYPLDCWRIMPDGMRYLFDQTNQLAQYDIRIVNESDIIGSAFKV